MRVSGSDRRDLFGGKWRGEARQAQKPIKPYPVYWGALPEPLLCAKDWLRHHLMRAGRTLADQPCLTPLWRATFGARLLADVNESGLLFIHIPKTAGTSVSTMIYGRNLPHFTLAQYEARLGEAARQVVSFSVVRDPIDRFISAFWFHRGAGPTWFYQTDTSGPVSNPCATSAN